MEPIYVRWNDIKNYAQRWKKSLPYINCKTIHSTNRILSDQKKRTSYREIAAHKARIREFHSRKGLHPMKIEQRHWILVKLTFFLLRLLFVSISLPYSLAWNTVSVSWLVFLTAAWICCWNGYVGQLALHLLSLLNPWLNVDLKLFL